MKKIRFLYGLLILAALLWANDHGGAFVYALLYLSISVPIVAFIYLQMIYRKISIKAQNLPEVVEKKTPFFYEVDVINHSQLGLANIEICFSKSDLNPEKNNKEVLCLLPRDKKKLTRLLASDCRGCYEIGIDQIIISDFFNFFNRYRRVKNKQQVFVLPHLSELNDLKGFEMLSKPLERGARLDGELDTELRNYQIGDSMKAVHWKASAKKRTLLSRKMIMVEETDYKVVMDCSPLEAMEEDRNSLEDCMIETMLAITYYLVRQGERSLVSLEQSSEKEITSPEEVYALQKACCFLRFEQEQKLEDKLRQMLAMQRGVGRFILIVHKLSEILITTMKQMLISGDRLVVFIVSDELSKSDLEELWRVGIMCFQVKTEGLLKEWLEVGEEQ